MFTKLQTLFTDKSLRNRILFVVGILFLFRVLSMIPIPGVDTSSIQKMLDSNQLFGFLNVFSAGGISTLSLVMLGVGPYITASIIMQLMTVMVPKLKAMYQEEGEIGRRKFTQYSRLLTIPLAVFQAYGLLTVLAKSQVLTVSGPTGMAINVLVVTAGSVLLMWLGELITEKGIGNGVSVIIFAGIVANLPRHIAEQYFVLDVSQIPNLIALLLGIILVIAGVVFITEAQRDIPVTYSKQARGYGASGMNTSYLPLRLNQAGVIPIIFALSLFTIPQIAAQFMATSDSSTMQAIATAISSFFANKIAYALTYFALVFAFTYMYTAITFDPKQISENLQRNGAFVPGIRPGDATAEYLGDVITRITLVGALFLGIMAVLPIVIQQLTGITQFTVGGTSVLIVVSVVLDIIKKLDAQISMREY